MVPCIGARCYHLDMEAAGGIVGVLLGLILMAVGLLAMYFIVKAAVRNGVLEALDDSRSTVGVHKLITQLRGGSQPPQQRPAQQYPPQQ